MRLNFFLKILLIIGCMSLSIYLIFINYTLDKSISAQNTALSKLRGDPSLDSSENRKIYAQRKLEINRQIDELRTKRHPDWYRYVAILLSVYTGFLIKRTIPLFKRTYKR